MQPFIDLNHQNWSRGQDRARLLARAAVLARDLMLALGFGALCALVHSVWFTAFGAAVLLAGYYGKRYLRS